MQKETFIQRVPFQLATSGNEVLVSLNVATKEEVDSLIERVESMVGKLQVVQRMLMAFMVPALPIWMGIILM